MPRIKWDAVGERFFENGVDHGVLYPRNDTGAYPLGVPWNGLTSVSESRSGAESTPVYADNIKYIVMKSAEEFGCTIEAVTYPDEFEACNGELEVFAGVTVGQQRRQSFGFAWRTNLGNDVNPELGHKIHVVWGADAAPSEKAHNTVNDSPEATTFSWEVTTTATEVGRVAGKDFKPTAKLTFKSTDLTTAQWTALEDTLYGTEATPASLPTPAELLQILIDADGGEAGMQMAGQQSLPMGPEGEETYEVAGSSSTDYDMEDPGTSQV